MSYTYKSVKQKLAKIKGFFQNYFKNTNENNNLKAKSDKKLLTIETNNIKLQCRLLMNVGLQLDLFNILNEHEIAATYILYGAWYIIDEHGIATTSIHYTIFV